MTAERFAAFAWLRFEGMDPRILTLSDNWFYLLPGETITFSVSGLPSDLGEDGSRARLWVRHL